jgi:protein O-GlcNAc transferase
MNLQQMCDQAIMHHLQGRMEEAERLSIQVIAAAPANATACSLLGFIRFQQGRTEEATQLIDAALRVDPNAAGPLMVRGLLLQKARRLEEALGCFDSILTTQPDFHEALNNRGNVLCDLRRYADALRSYDRALAIRPAFFLAHVNRGRALRALSREAEALASFDKALAIEPRNAELLYNRGTILLDSGRFSEALESLDKSVVILPGLAEAWNNRGLALQSLGRFEEALLSYDKALAIKPDNIRALYSRSVTLCDMKRFTASLECFDRVIARKSNYAEAYSYRGVVLLNLKRFGDALASLEHALALNPRLADAWNNRGSALWKLNQLDKALESYNQALQLKPEFAEALVNHGSVLRELRRLDDALVSYDKAIALMPAYAEAWSNRGNLMRILDRYEEALFCYDRALALKPNFAEVLVHRGNLHWAKYRGYEQAVADLEQALVVDPNHDYVRGDLLHIKMHAAEWRNFSQDVVALDAGVREKKHVVRPFVYQSVSGSAHDLRACATLQAEHRYPATREVWNVNKRAHTKIRLGYLSGEFRAQATAYLMAELYERHDRQKFEVIAFDNGSKDDSPTRKRLESAIDKFVDISKISDLAAAQKIAAEETDILINLNGYFGEFRMGVFARKPAPIQVNYLGFPGTLGAGYIDYIIADRVVIPPDECQHYRESVVWLPDSYQVNDSRRLVSNAVPSRAECGLPDDAFVFCSFNQGFKLTPDMFSAWMRILTQVKGSVLWLLEGNTVFPENLRREAARQGVAAERLVFASPVATDMHLARMKCGDLFLDTLPCNAHTTASDALWVGLPILTCRGHAFAGRVAASLLNAIGLPELITENLAEYEAKAIKLAHSPILMRALREKLGKNKLTAPLFDACRLTHHIESAYSAMWDIFKRGEAPRNFSVDSVSASAK